MQGRTKLICKLLWQEGKGFVTSRKDVIALLFCLLLTSCIWFFYAIDHKRSPEMSIQLVYTGVPDNLTIRMPEQLTVEISDEGKNFYANRSKKSLDTLEIDLSPYIQNDQGGSIRIEQEDLARLLEQQLPSTAIIVRMNPQNLIGYYNKQSTHQVPVIFQGSITAADQYILNQRPIVSPQTVHVYGPESVLDTLSCIYTKPYNLKGLKDTLRVQLKLQLPKGCRTRPQTVRLTAAASQFTEKRFTLPVEVINAPAGSQVKALPSEVEVICNVSLTNYASVNPQDIHVILDYSLHDESGKILLTARYNPDLLSNVRINPAQVDYVVE